MKKLFKKTTSTILALAVSFQTASINTTNAIKANAEKNVIIRIMKISA